MLNSGGPGSVTFERMVLAPTMMASLEEWQRQEVDLTSLVVRRSQPIESCVQEVQVLCIE